MINTLSKSSGPVEISLSKHLKEIFDLDKEVTDQIASIRSFKNIKEFYKVFVKENKTKNYIWNDENGNLIGYFSFIENTDNKNFIELFNLAVRPKYQKKGFGTKMLGFYHDLLKKKGFRSSRLYTSPDNIPAVYFYKKHGYKKTD